MASELEVGKVNISSANGVLQMGIAAANGSPALKLCEQVSSGDISNGFSFNVDGDGTNNLHIKRHVVSASGTDVMVIARDSGDISLPTAGQTIKTDLSSGGTTRTSVIELYNGSTGALSFKTDNSATGGVEFWTEGTKRLDVTRNGVCNFNNGINLGHETITKYDEGTFTPTIAAETGTINGTNVEGRYTRIGNVCHVWFTIECTGVSGASGAVEFGNFPFTSSSIASDFNTPMVVRYVSLGSAVESLVLRLFNNSTGGRIEEQNGTSVTNLADNVQTGTVFQVAGAYRLANG